MNKSKNNRALSLLMVLVMILAMIPMNATPAIAAPGDAGIKVEGEAVAPDVYKLVFSAMTPENISSMMVLFTYDDAVIQPIASAAPYADIAIVNDAVSNAPMEELCVPDSGFIVMMARWKFLTTRMGFECTLTCLGGNVVSNGSYVDMFAFYFRLQNGKTIDDVDDDTFSLVDGSDSSGFIDIFYPAATPDDAGITIRDIDNVETYLLGAVDQTSYPNNVEFDEIDISIFTSGPVVAIDDNYTVEEGAYFVLLDSVLDNDPSGVTVAKVLWGSTEYDVPADGVKITTSLGGIIIMFQDGTFRYTAPVRDHGDLTPDIDSFQYKVVNNTGMLSAYATVYITLTDTEPVAVDDHYTLTVAQKTERFKGENVITNDQQSLDWFEPRGNPEVIPVQNIVWQVRTEDGETEITLSDTPYDPNGAHTVETVNGGKVWINKNGNFEYLPATDFKGEDSFQYILYDADGSPSDWATVTFQVPGPPPIAEPDAYTIEEGSHFANLGNVLDNDPPGATVAKVRWGSNDYDVSVDGFKFTSSLGGIVVILQDGTLNYTAPVRDHGDTIPDIDSFGYYIANNEGTISTSYVMVSIAITDTEPVAVDDDFSLLPAHHFERLKANVILNDQQSLDWERPQGQPDPLQNYVWKVRTEDGTTEFTPPTAYDPDGAQNVTTVNGGKVWIDEYGNFEYEVPSEVFKGEDSFQYQLNDADKTPSDWATVTLQVPQAPDVLTGTAMISNMTPRIGDTLVGSLVGTNNSGDLIFTWKSGSTTLSTGNSYEVQQSDLGHSIALEVESTTEYGSRVSAPTDPVLKKVAPAAPAAPTLDTKTSVSITLVATAGYEYSINGIDWEASNVFSGLTPDTAYTFYQRIKETDDTEASAVSPALIESTDAAVEPPSITGPSEFSLPIGYATPTSIVFTVTGDLPIAVTLDNDYGGAFVWNITDESLDIVESLPVGEYSVTLTATNTEGNDTTSFTFRVTAIDVPPTITSADSVTFVEGTGGSFTLTASGTSPIQWELDGSEPAGVSLSGDILIVAATVTADTYAFIIKANNVTATEDTQVFTLIIGPSAPLPPIATMPSITGPSDLTLTVGYTATSSAQFTPSGNPIPTVSQDTDHGGNIVWNNVTQRLDISAGLPIGTYAVVLTASNSEGIDTVTFTLTVRRASGGGSYIGGGSGGSGGTTPIDDIQIPGEETPFAFTDVSEDDWFYDAVMFMYSKDLMIGVPANKFDPNGTLTRGMIVTILYRLAGEPSVDGLTNPFNDVAEELWYTDAIKWGADNGIVFGYGNGRFGPNDPVTKEQLAALIFRTQQAENTALANCGGIVFDDIGNISDWALEAVNSLNEQGLFNDLPSTTFSPRSPATRAEVASIFYKWLSQLD